ncbi:Serine/threonine-protein kinase pkn3 [Minicystis rosea]|nr:Serine/threonine-protein kinase pkn3 [Minicystis rosea]
MDEPTPHNNPLAGTAYRIVGKIGEGGMGTVLEAEHEALGKRVVVKLLLPQHARDPGLVERLRREARVLARVTSPHLVAVTDLGRTADGSTYLVMERLHGHTLRRELVLRGALPVADAITWTKQILMGLTAAHRAGIVHRDIKLDNIFLCDGTDQEPRRIKLLDFGIAKVLKGSGLDSGARHPTAEGALMGSPRWLAPEQAMGKAVDTRTDIYAAGLVLYSLVVGRSPFAHLRDPMDAISATLLEEPTMPSLCATQHIPPALDDAIMMAIEKSPERRFQSAEAFIAALDAVAAPLPLERTQPLPVRRVVAEPRVDTVHPLPGTAQPSAVGALESASSEVMPIQGAVPQGESHSRSLTLFLALTAASAGVFLVVSMVLMRALGWR